MTVTISETACDSCRRRFQAIDRPAEQVAAEYGWHITNVVLCPGCAEAATDPDTYGRHHRDVTQSPIGETARYIAASFRAWQGIKPGRHRAVTIRTARRAS